MKKYEFILKNLDCAGCANEIQEKLQKNPKLYNVNVNFAKLKFAVSTNKKEQEYIAEALSDVDGMISSLEKLIAKKKASKSETAQDKANLSTMDFILEALATAPNGMTITELTKSPKIAEVEGNSIHRVSALVTKLKNINKVVRTEVKGVARFSLATEAEATEESGE